MLELAKDPVARIVLYFAVGAALVLIGIYVVGLVRGGAGEKQATAQEILADFRDMHDQGDLSDDEFRNIKLKLAGQLEGELRGNEETR